MVTDGEKWHYLAVKKLSGLFRGIISNHKEEFYCLNCFHSCNTKNTYLMYVKIMIIVLQKCLKKIIKY